MFDATPPQRHCVDWALLMRSMEDRVVGEEELGQLTNPLSEAVH